MARALVDICRGRVVDVPADPVVRAELVDAVRHHRIAPLAHVALREGDPELAEVLRPDRDAALAMHLRSAVALDELGGLLADVPWATFKGPTLSERAHPVPGLRTSRDLDLLVGARTLREVCARFAAAGWEVVDYRDTLLLPEVRGEVHWRTGTGLVIDLHWSMLNMADERRRFRVATDDLLARRRPAVLGFTSAPVLDPVDAFVHVCLHAAMSGADRMQYLLDVDGLVRAVDDWERVAERAREWRVALPVALVLARARAVLGSPVPPQVDRLLRGPAVLRLVDRTTDRLFPVPTLRQDASVVRLVARAARHGAAPTAGALVTKALLASVHRMPSRLSVLPEEPADAESLETYLRAVESELRDGRGSAG